MKKVGKILLGVVVVVVVLLLVFVLTLPLTISPIVKTAASVGGPKALGVPVTVGDVKLNALAGNLAITGVQIGNPEGYSDKEAFAVQKIDVGLDMRSLFSDTIVVKRIEIDSPAISYEIKDGKSNFDVMLANVKKSSEEEKEKEEKPKGEKDAKKVIIEEFKLTGAKVSHASALTLGKSVTLPLPPLTLKDIGKKGGGATVTEAVSEVISGVLGGLTGAATAVVDGVGGVVTGAGKAATGALKGAAAKLMGSGDDAKKAASDVADDAKETAESLKKDAKEAVEGAKESAEDAKGAVKEATKGLKNLFK